MWGAKTRAYTATTIRLDKKKWTTILQAAVERMDWSVADEGDVEEGINVDPRALIDI